MSMDNHDNEILFVFNSEEQLAAVGKSGIIMPVGWSYKYCVLPEGNLAASLNLLQRQHPAKYKLYFNAPIAHVRPSLVLDVINSFAMSPRTAMLGIMGSEMPLDGDFAKAKSVYGLYSFRDSQGRDFSYQGKNPLLIQHVHVLDSGFVATCRDIEWDEAFSDGFAFVAAGLGCRMAGHKISVMGQNEPSLVFAADKCVFSPQRELAGYEESRQLMRGKYKDSVMPLVSILIPTYNQPEYCRQALESALRQDYGNIEIVIGDDSTDERTKKMVEPYLAEHGNIKYFYHGGPLGLKGRKNMRFLLNHCQGEYINYLLHDDLFYPTKISKMMAYYTMDLENRLSMVASVRHSIDQEGRVTGIMSPWVPRADTELSGEEAARKMLFGLSNFIGEYTTVLLKKDLLRASRYGEPSIEYSAGVFCGIADMAHGDMGTWLNMCRFGSCLFMAECLSAFRHHPDQSTNDMGILTGLIVENIGYFTVAWLNDLYIHSEEEYMQCCRYWLPSAERWLLAMGQSGDAGLKGSALWLGRLAKAVQSGAYAEVLHNSVECLLAHLEDGASISALVRRDSITGMWRKRDRDMCCEQIWQ